MTIDVIRRQPCHNIDGFNSMTKQIPSQNTVKAKENYERETHSRPLANKAVLVVRDESISGLFRKAPTTALSLSLAVIDVQMSLGTVLLVL